MCLLPLAVCRRSHLEQILSISCLWNPPPAGNFRTTRTTLDRCLSGFTACDPKLQHRTVTLNSGRITPKSKPRRHPRWRTSTRMNQRSFLTNNPSVELALLSHPLAQQGKLTFFPVVICGQTEKKKNEKKQSRKKLSKSTPSHRRNKDKSINSAINLKLPTGAILDIRTRWRVSAGRPGQTLPLYNNPRTPP